jgi:HD superfamily phosphodiesterase
MRIPFTKICTFINHACNRYNIDESHGIKHALDVYKNCRNIIIHETNMQHVLNEQQNIIYTAALLHDTCDKKYMDEDEGIKNIENFLDTTKCYSNVEKNIIIKIIQTMSYSKVKEYGFPELGPYTLSYHVVREADLLAAYDFDRGLIFTMNHYNVDYKNAFTMAKDLYATRMAKQLEQGLITTHYGRVKANELLKENLQNIELIDNMLKYDT